MSDVPRPVKPENPNFKCKKCASDQVFYTTGETSDGAYDIYYYDCHACKHFWRVVADFD